MKHTSLALLLALGIGACGGSAETPPAPAVEAPTPPTPPPPPRHAGLPALDLGAEITLSAEEAAAATAVAEGGATSSSWRTYGGAQAFFRDAQSGVEPAALQQRMLWLARTRSDATSVVAAISKLGGLADSGTDWPADHADLLRGLISHSDPLIASAAVAAARRALRADEPTSALLRKACVDHTHPIVRAEACASVGARPTSLSEDEASLAALVSEIDDEEPMTGYAAIYALQNAFWSEKLPPNTYDQILVAARSTHTLLRSQALSALASLIASHRRDYDATKQAAAVTLLEGALNDPEAWVRSEAISALGSLDHTAASFDAIAAKLDDTAPLRLSLPMQVLTLEPGPSERAYTSSRSTGYPEDTVGTWALYSLRSWATNGASGRIPTEIRLVPSAPTDPAVTRTELMAWWAAHRDAVIAATAQP